MWKMIKAPLMQEAASDGAESGAGGQESASTSENEFSDIHNLFEEGIQPNSQDTDDNTSDGDSDLEEGKKPGGKKPDPAKDSSDDDDSTDDDEVDDKDEEEEEGEQQTPLTAEQLTELRNNYESKFAETFEISEEEADALRTEPEKVFPQLAARVHLKTVDLVQGMLRQGLPRLVESVVRQVQAGDETDNKFFSEYQELNTPKGRKVVLQVAKAYRAANPEATFEEAKEAVGFMAWKKLGLSMDKLAEKMGMGGEQEEFVSSGKPRKSSPKPEGAGKGMQKPPAKKEEVENEFTEINDLLDSGNY